MAMTLPDFNQVLAKMNGRLLPFGWWHFLRKGKIRSRARRLPRASSPSTSTPGVAAKLYQMHFDAAERTPAEGRRDGLDPRDQHGHEPRHGRDGRARSSSATACTSALLVASGRGSPSTLRGVSESRCSTRAGRRRLRRRCSTDELDALPALGGRADAAARPAGRSRRARHAWSRPCRPRRWPPADSSRARRSSASCIAASGARRSPARSAPGAPAWRRQRTRRDGPASWCRSSAAARCWWTCTCSAAPAIAEPALTRAGRAARARSRRRPVPAAAADAAWTACCAAAAACSSGCCTTARSRCVVRVAQTRRRRASCSARARRTATAAEVRDRADALRARRRRGSAAPFTGASPATR